MKYLSKSMNKLNNNYINMNNNNIKNISNTSNVMDTHLTPNLPIGSSSYNNVSSTPYYKKTS